MLEIVACSPQEALDAQASGATQLEVCLAIELGGLTPTPGLIEVLKRVCTLPLFAMVRPRAGGFCLDDREFDVMIRDAEALLESGADGLIYGILQADGQLHEERMRYLANLTEDRQAICHRAFDRTPDRFDALEQLIDLGFTRVLTSGGTSNALEGAEELRRLHEAAGGRVEILPGGGIRSHNADELLRQTGIPRLHAAPAQQPGPDGQRQVDPFEINRLAESLKNAISVVK